jgi:transposase
MAGKENASELARRCDAPFPPCPIPGVARLGRRLKQWKTAILAYFDNTVRPTNPPERSTASSKTAHRVGRRFRNFTNYRLRCLLAAGGPPRQDQMHEPCLIECEGPLNRVF